MVSCSELSLNEISWPQFGPGELPQHGFARSSAWSIKETHADKDVTLTLILSDTDDSKKVWNNSFLVEYKISLHEHSISFEFKVTNKNSEKSFSFTSALHTYFKISDSQKVQIVGLKGLTYIDKVQKGQKFEEKNDSIHFIGETDRKLTN